MLKWFDLSCHLQPLRTISELQVKFIKKIFVVVRLQTMNYGVGRENKN